MPKSKHAENSGQHLPGARPPKSQMQWLDSVFSKTGGMTAPVCLIALILCLALIRVPVSACTPEEFFALMATLEQAKVEKEAATVTVFLDSALFAPMRDVVTDFNSFHPEIKVVLEPSPANMAVRKITELGRTPDVLMTFGVHLVQIEKIVPDHSPCYVQFARDRIVLAYTDASAGGAGLTEVNWQNLFFQGKARFGKVSHASDPLGVYTESMAKILSARFGEPFKEAWKKSFAADQVRMDPIDLVKQLEAGNLDYCFVYASIASAHRLKVIDIPEEAALGFREMNWAQSDASSVDLVRSDATYKIPGSPILAVACVLKESPHPGASSIFLAYLAGKGQAAVDRAGLISHIIEGVHPRLGYPGGPPPSPNREPEKSR